MFTGLPGLLAIAGAFFMLRRIYLWQSEKKANLSAPAQEIDKFERRQTSKGKHGFARVLAKGSIILIGAAMLIGFIGGILSGVAK